MPLNAFQTELVKRLAKNRNSESYLAGGAAIHLTPQSIRFSNDLDYFHDSEQNVAEAFEKDSLLLKEAGYQWELDIKQPGYLRAIVSKGSQATKVEWAQDTAWRFLPIIEDNLVGYRLHDIDLAINKVLALAGRNEARDVIDSLYLHDTVLSLGALIFAASSKDPGFTPLTLLDLLKRRGQITEDDILRLQILSPKTLTEYKQAWMAALEQAEAFIQSRPPSEFGALYYDQKKACFFTPEKSSEEYTLHFPQSKGIWPQVIEES